jgi:hypothetical protein
MHDCWCKYMRFLSRRGKRAGVEVIGGGCEVRFGSIPTRQNTDPNLRRGWHCVWGTCHDQEATLPTPTLLG